jgi:hypothetical protein
MAIVVNRVSAAQVPGTSHKGRRREPNDFDQFMVVYCAEDFTDADGNVEWDGWNQVKASSEDELKKLVAKLVSASNYAQVGLEKRADEMSLTLYFKVKPRTFKPRTRSEDALTVNEGDQDMQPTLDVQTPKRTRKAA